MILQLFTPPIKFKHFLAFLTGTTFHLLLPVPVHPNFAMMKKKSITLCNNYLHLVLIKNVIIAAQIDFSGYLARDN